MRLYLLLIIVAAIGVAAVSEMSFQDALKQESHYTSMVCAGLWPDYDDLKPNCEVAK